MAPVNLTDLDGRIEISVEVRRGSGMAAFFADVRLFRALTIPDWPVWKADGGSFQPAEPTKLGKDGRRFPLIRDLSPEYRKEIFAAILEACKSEGQ